MLVLPLFYPNYAQNLILCHIVCTQCRVVQPVHDFVPGPGGPVHIMTLSMMQTLTYMYIKFCAYSECFLARTMQDLGGIRVINGVGTGYYF